jgi:hypothetical protein
MEVPASDSPQWAEILTGKKRIAFEFLAARILVGSLIVQVKFYPNELDNSVESLRTIFEKNISLASAQRDLTKIFGA